MVGEERLAEAFVSASINLGVGPSRGGPCGKPVIILPVS